MDDQSDLVYDAAEAAVVFIGQIWSGADPAAAAGMTLTSLVGTLVKGKSERRRLEADLRDLAEQVSERLEPIARTEFAGLSHAERASAILEVKRSIAEARALDLRLALNDDLDAARLATRVREADADAKKRAGLGEAGSQLYELLLDESMACVAELVSRLPTYRSALDQELLGRTKALTQLSQQILKDLPRSNLPSEWGEGSEDVVFATQYRRAVARHVDRLELFGVRSEEAKRAYPLSMAYVSLSAANGANQTAAAHTAKPDARAADHRLSHVNMPNSARIESLLDNTSALLLVGDAGSGKSTITQWIALASVRDDDRSSIPENWRNRVPFMVRLRRFANVPLPTVEQLAREGAAAIADLMPKGWVHRILAAGRGTLLVDGLDELPLERRDEVREWMREILDQYPGRYVTLTTRSTALEDRLVPTKAFTVAELLPMTPSDVRSFIHYWHLAAANEHPDGSETRTRIQKAAKGMEKAAREQPAIRAMCTSPLLCALMCALNLGGGGNLPENRMDLYRTAFEMLVHERDRERNISIRADIKLELRERTAILREFARWMHEGGLAEASLDDYAAAVSRATASLHRLDAAPADVAAFLLERSGLLRSPAPGWVDFVHRTFLEFLAANAFVHEDAVPQLIKNAHDDHWREVVVLAAGLANGQQVVRLLEGLLERAQLESQHRHRLILLTSASLETAIDIPPTLAERIRSSLLEVVPPESMADAAAIASAGTLAVELLGRQTPKRLAVQDRACVRALSLIGTEEAMEKIATFSADSRVTVQRELIRAWTSFDPETYAREVLADAVLENGFLTVSDTDTVPHLALLRSARGIFVDVPGRYSHVQDLPTLPSSVYGVDFSRIEGLRTIADLPFQNLESITLKQTQLESLSGLEGHPSLFYLSVAHCRELTGSPSLEIFQNLRYLDVSGTGFSDLDFIRTPTPVKEVSAIGMPRLRRISSPVTSRSLSLGELTDIEDLSGLELSTELRSLAILNVAHQTLRLPSNLARLSVYRGIDSDAVSGGDSLTYASFGLPIGAQTLEWLTTLPQLAEVSVPLDRSGSTGGLTADAFVQRMADLPSIRKIGLHRVPRSAAVDAPRGFSSTASYASYRMFTRT